MTENNTMHFDGALFNENRRMFPAQELFRYARRYVAWNLEGTRILASGVDDDELHANLAAAGIALNQLVQSYVPSGEEALL